MKQVITNNKRKISTILMFTMILSLLSINTLSVTAEESSYNIMNPRVENGVSTWDCIWFGNYWQNDTNGDGVADENDEKEPIKWRVLSIDGDDAFLLADKELGLMRQHGNARANMYEGGDSTSWSWDKCYLRTWLNTDFYQDAFFGSNIQKAVKTTSVINEDFDSVWQKCKYVSPIDPENTYEYYAVSLKDIPQYDINNNTNDKVYLLSVREAMNPSYGFIADSKYTDTRKAEPTEYVMDIYDNNWSYYFGPIDRTVNQNFDWWLRTPSYSTLFSSAVWYEGDIGGRGASDVIYEWCTIRPCIHIDLSSPTWSKAGTVSSSGEVNEIIPEIILPEPETPSTSEQETTTDNPSTTEQLTAEQTTPGTQTSTESPTDNSSNTTVKAPSQVKKVTGKNNKKKSATLSWKKVSGAKGYQIQYATNKKFKSAKSKTVTKTKATITKLKKKKTYYFRIRAYELNGKTKVYGKWSKTLKLKIKK